MRIPAMAVLAVLLNTAPALAQSNQLAVSAYLNSLYCIGVAEVYAERLGQAAGRGHRPQARDAQKVALDLKGYAEGLRSRYRLSDARARGAQDHGRSAMSRELPAGGAWQSADDVPREAVRQYQHCRSLVR